jgi:hypothetical protein
VKDVCLLRGVREDIDVRALDAIRRWRYEPARLRHSTPPGARVSIEIAVTLPEYGPSSLIATIGSRRSPFSRRYSMHGQLSPDGTCLALPLTAGETTNLWLVPVDGGPPRPVTDFGSRATLIVRWASWTPDGRHLVAAVAETDVDIVSFDGLL